MTSPSFSSSRLSLAPLRSSVALSLVAAVTFASSPVRAQLPSEVQPVPYAPSQPVPYAPPAPPPSSPPPPTTMTLTGAGPAVQGNDVVTLKGGGMIRGLLVEVIPNDHATVQLVTGQTAQIPWDRIEHIEHAASTTVAPKGAASHDVAPAAWVHVESDRPVRVERHTREGRGGWTPVCSSPCDEPLATTEEYRITGDGIRASAPFTLEGRPGERIELRVSTGSKSGFVGGIVLIGAGPLLALIGAVVLITESAATQIDEDYSTGTSETTHTDNSTAKGVGVTLVVGGMALAIGGILMTAGNVHSHVKQQPFEAGPPQDAWLRTPTWREDRVNASLPKTYDLPLFHASF